MSMKNTFSAGRGDVCRLTGWAHRLPTGVAAALAGLAMLLGGCEPPAQQAAPAAAPTVVVAKVQQRDVVPFEIRTGNLAANQTVTILPRVSAFVETIPFKPGDFVKAQTVLFTLDNTPFRSQLAQAKSTLDVRKSDVDVRKAELAVAQANLLNATDEMDRQERLNKQQATNEKDLMSARYNQRAAVAAVDSAKAAVASAVAMVDAAVAAVAAAQVNVDYCVISTPLAGKVDINNVNVGDLVVTTGQKPLTTVREIDPIKVDFTLSEPLVVEYLQKRGMDPNRKTAIPVKLSLGNENDFRYDAVLDFVSNVLDQSTGTVVVQATAKNPDLKLYPGMFVRVKLDLPPLPKAILVSEASLSRDIGGDYVWVIKPDNTAEKRYVKVGTLVDQFRVVQSGLAADETYVVQGVQRVRDRSKVTPQPAGDAPTTNPAR
jgi:membrane fusion protein, multidrug efflux system